MTNQGRSARNIMFNLAYSHLNDANLHRSLNLAQSHFTRREYAACMQRLALLVTTLFESRIEPVGRLARRILATPKCIRLTKTDLGIRALLTQSEFFKTDCAVLASYVYSLSTLLEGSSTVHPCVVDQNNVAIVRLCKRSFTESLALRIESYLTRCSVPEDFLRGNRIRLKASIRLYFLLVRRMPQIHEQMSLEKVRLGAIFHEPAEKIEKMLMEHYLYSRLNFARHVLRLRNETLPDVVCDEFFWPEKSCYQRMVACINESRVLTTIHMGDVVGAFRNISSVTCKSRRVISITQKHDGFKLGGYSASDTGVYASTNTSDMDPIAMVAALRGGNTTLAVLFDLTSEFGDTVEVIFFGRRTRLGKGPAQVAIAAKVKILPFVTYDVDGRSILEMGPLIDTGCLPGESLNRATSRITQMLATQAEKWIMRHPSQWRYTTSIFNFFNRGREC
jgi:hypothetical protein